MHVLLNANSVNLFAQFERVQTQIVPWRLTTTEILFFSFSFSLHFENEKEVWWWNGNVCTNACAYCVIVIDIGPVRIHDTCSQCSRCVVYVRRSTALYDVRVVCCTSRTRTRIHSTYSSTGNLLVYARTSLIVWRMAFSTIIIYLLLSLNM